MDLRERKQIVNGKLPEYAGGKLLHGASQSSIDGMVAGGVNLLGSAINSFGGVKSSGDIVQESGTSIGQGSGFTYQKQNAVDTGAQMSELSRQNTTNTLQTAAAGASLGSAFGPIGAGIGGVVGGAVGVIGGLFRKSKMADRIREAQLQTIRNNNFSLASAQTDYLTNQYNLEHDNTQDGLIYHAKDGKLPGFANGFDGRAKISNGEIYGHVDAFGNVIDMHRAGRGKDNKDTLIRNLGDTQDEFNRAFVVTNKGGASDYVAATGDVNGGLEIGNIMKDFRTVLQLKNGKFPGFVDQKTPAVTWPTITPVEPPLEQSAPKISPYRQLFSGLSDDQKRSVLGYSVEPELSQAQKDSFLQQYDKQNSYFEKQNTTRNSAPLNWANAITTAAGLIGGYSQFAHRNDELNRPNIEAANPYERQALATAASLRPNTNAKLAAMAHAEARNRYNINRMGGLSGAQKYLNSVASGTGLQRNIADVIGLSNEELNKYKGSWSQLAANLGAQQAQRRMTAQQYLDEAYARSHGARTQFEQMGMQNMLSAFNNYFKNLQNLNMFDRTMAYYDQDYQLRKNAINRGWVLV